MRRRGTWSTGLDGLAKNKSVCLGHTISAALGLNGLGGEDLQLLGCNWAGDRRHGSRGRRGRSLRGQVEVEVGGGGCLSRYQLSALHSADMTLKYIRAESLVIQFHKKKK